MNWPKFPPDLPLVEFAIVFLIGALVGIDRERRKAQEQQDEIGGLRTFILLAEAGGVAAWLALRLDSLWIFAAAALVVGALIIAGYFASTRGREAALGQTTEVAAVVVFFLGGLVIFGFRDLAVVLAIVTSAVLAYKHPLHGLVLNLSEDDVYAGLKLLIATFIVLPILPNQPLDPWGALNPYKMWWLVILISGLSLAGYVAARWLGSQHGLALTGLFGGLASSTAVTLSFARRSSDRNAPAGMAEALAAGLLLAWTVMFGRIAVEVAVVHRPLLPVLAVPLASMGIAAALAAGVFYWRSRSADTQPAENVPLKNPFSLTSAARFALLFTVVELAVKLVQTYWPGRGFYAVAALAGLTDVDAITLSMAQYAKDGGSPQDAAVSIAIAALTNTLVKLGLVAALGAAGLRWRTIAATVLIVACGGAAVYFLFLGAN